MGTNSLSAEKSLLALIAEKGQYPNPVEMITHHPEVDSTLFSAESKQSFSQIWLVLDLVGIENILYIGIQKTKYLSNTTVAVLKGSESIWKGVSG